MTTIMKVRTTNVEQRIRRPTDTTEFTSGPAGPPGSVGPIGATGPPSRSLLVMSIPGAMRVSTGVIPVVMTTAMTVTVVRAACGLAPTGADLVLTVNANTVPIATVVIPAGATIGPETAPAVIVNDGDRLTVDIVQIGSIDPGSDLSLTVEALISV